MPWYTTNFLIFATEAEMAKETNAASAAAAEAAAITYFEDGGSGPLAGLTKTTTLTMDQARTAIAEETLTPEDGDYVARTARFGTKATSAPAS